MPGPETAHSPNADDLNALYVVMVVIGLLLMVAVNAALIGIAVRYRAQRGREPQRLKSRGIVQTGTAAAFGVIAAAIFVAGVMTTEDASEVEATGSEGLQASSLITAQRSLDLPSGDDVSEPLEIQATGQQWIWRYEYPDGTFSYYELVVPVDTAVVVKLASTDVVHRWWVPGLGGKFDAVPGQSNQTWFKVDSDELDENGEATFDGASYAFSGAAYAAMRTRVRALSASDYEDWLSEQAAGIQEAQTFVQEEVAAAPRPGTEQAVEAEAEGE